MTTAIYFDLDGTLISYEKGFQGIFEQSLGFEVSEEIYDYWTEQVLGNIRNIEEKPYQKALEAVEKKFELGIDPEEATEKYIQAEIDCIKINRDLKDVLEKLSEKHQVGILTNGAGHAQRRKIERYGLDKLVDEVIISNTEGIRKPDPEIFELARDRLDADNYIYIGDTFDHDIVPAKQNGFKTVYIGGEREADLEAKNPESLGQLLNLVL